MESMVFGELNPVDYFDDETALDGTFRALGDVNCHVTIRGDFNADRLVTRAESLYQLFQKNLLAVKQEIKDWIPTLYRESGFEFNGDVNRLVDAIRIDTFTFMIGEEDSENWLYCNVEAGLSEEEKEGLLSGHDIVLYFDDNMKVVRLEMDG